MTTPLIKPAPPRTATPSHQPAREPSIRHTGTHTRPDLTKDKLSVKDKTLSDGAPNPMSNLRRRMSNPEFNTAMIHFYRGEVQRSNAWRNRLDTTTNWAVLTAGATLSFAFSAPQNPHFVILINSLLVAFFLFMEARRYRYYEIWSSRVRVLETGYLAGLLQPELERDDSWTETLARDLHTPHFTISEWEAVGRRLRRNYLWIFMLLAASWNLKVYVHPAPARDFEQFIERAAVGLVPGSYIFTFGIVFNVALVVFALATIRLREATGEVLPDHDFNFDKLTSWSRSQRERRATNRRAKRARERTRSTTASHATGEWRKITGALRKPVEQDDKTPAEISVIE